MRRARTDITDQLLMDLDIPREPVKEGLEPSSQSKILPRLAEFRAWCGKRENWNTPEVLIEWIAHTQRERGLSKDVANNYLNLVIAGCIYYLGVARDGLRKELFYEGRKQLAKYSAKRLVPKYARPMEPQHIVELIRDAPDIGWILFFAYVAACRVGDLSSLIKISVRLDSSAVTVMWETSKEAKLTGEPQTARYVLPPHVLAQVRSRWMSVGEMDNLCTRAELCRVANTLASRGWNLHSI